MLVTIISCCIIPTIIGILCLYVNFKIDTKPPTTIEDFHDYWVGFEPFPAFMIIPGLNIVSMLFFLCLLIVNSANKLIYERIKHWKI